MTPFGFLIVAHLIGDYLFQTSWMAANKATKWMPLLVHCLVYTAVIAIVAFIGFGGLSLVGIIFVFVSHVFLDRRTFVVWWVENVMRTDVKQMPWLAIMVDQIFHVIVLVIALYV